MTRIALIADLHFGSVPPQLADHLLRDLDRIRPDLIIVAGDLTMRSTRSEFADARTWLDRLQAPLLLLPGNHDLPVWSLYERFTQPFARYSRNAGTKLMPVFEDEQSFVLGLNTTASWQPNLRWQEGVARKRDVAAARLLLAASAPDKAHIVATHHPLLPIQGFPRARPARRAARAVAMLAEQKVDMLLSGHIHQTYAVAVEQPGGRIIAVGAPTALSTRMRGEPNGFWLISVLPERFRLCLHRYDGGAFVPAVTPVDFIRPGAGDGLI